MKFKMGFFLVAAGLWMAQATSPVLAQAAASESVVPDNSIEAMDVSRQGASIYVKLRLKTPLAQPPASFSVANPARIAFDFPGQATAWAAVCRPSTRAIFAAPTSFRSETVRVWC